MSFALQAAITLRSRVRRIISADTRPTDAERETMLQCEAVCAALSVEDFELYRAWAFESLTQAQREELARMCRPRGDA